MDTISLRLNRRRFLMGTSALAAAATLGVPAFAQDKSLTMTWWGPAERHKSYLAAIALYQAETGVPIRASYGGFDGYFEKLQTQMAGGAAPDLFQIRGGPPPLQYINRGLLLDLTPYIGSAIATQDLETSVFESVRYQGKVYEIPQGVGTTALYINKTQLEELGGEIPDNEWTWDDFATLAKELAKNAPEGVYGTTDVWATGGRPSGFRVFIRQRGKELYTEDGQLGYEKADVIEWLNFWKDLRDAGAVTPPDVTAGAKSSDGTSSLVTRQAPMYFSWTGILVGLQELTSDELVPQLLPNGPAGSRLGQSLEADGPVAISANTANPDAAVAFLNFLINNPACDELLGTVNGVPISARRNAVLRELASGAAQRDFDYIREASAHSTPLTVIQPEGALEVETGLLHRLHEDVAFGRQSIEEGVNYFFDEAGRILSA